MHNLALFAADAPKGDFGSVEAAPSGRPLASQARHDPLHCITPGLFRSLKKGDRQRKKLDIRYNFGDASVRFWGPEPLGVDDMRVLQGLVALASMAHPKRGGAHIDWLENAPNEQDRSYLKQMLEPKFDVDQGKAILVQDSYRQLARVIGYEDYDSGRTFKSLRACMERLWAVSVVVERGGERQGFRILSEYASDSKVGKLTVALNPHLAEAIVGARQYYRLDMAEVRSLRSDCARLLHQRLLWLNPGRTARIGMETLCEYVWPEPSENAETLKSRRKSVRAALQNLQELSWGVSEPSRGFFEVSRPAATLMN